MNLIDALGGCEAEHAVCTTYPFEPLFFGNYAIDPLQKAGVPTPIVLMDDQQYETLAQQQELTSRAIGQHYYLEPVAVESTFHPKVAFLAGESACHVSVTSANITLAEYTTAAQLGQTVTVSAEPETDAEEPTLQEIAVAQDVRDFIDQLCREYVSGKDARTEVRRAVAKTDWIEDRSRPESASGGFVHNLETPILTQVLDDIGEVSQATLFAPFFGNTSTLAEIDAQINADEYEILVSEGNTHLKPKDAVEAFNDTVNFRLISHDTGRWIHAKGIVFEGRWGTATLYGSPNITGRALLETATTGNLEAGFLHYDSDVSDSRLWNQDTFPATLGATSDPEEFDFAEYSFSGDTDPGPSLTLSDARVERSEDDEILARFIAPEITDGTTVTVESITESTVEVVWSEDTDDDEDGVLLQLPDSFAHAIVRLRLPDGNQTNYRQITTEPTTGTRKVGNVLRDDGREAVQSLVDETLFLGVGIAPTVLTDAVSRLSEKYEKQEEAPPKEMKKAGKEDTNNPPLSTGVKGLSTPSREPHLAVKDGMKYATKRIDSLLNKPPSVASIEELIDHFENLWYYITRGLVRSALSPQLENTNDDAGQVETNLNVSRLHSICAKQLSAIFESRYLTRISTHVNRICLVNPESTTERLDTDKLTDTFVTYPAIALSLMDWHGEAFVGRFEFMSEYYRAMTAANPLIAERLLDGQLITERLNQHEATLNEQVSNLGERIGADVSLPGDFIPGLEVLFYGFWFRELARTSDTDLFGNSKIFDQYEPAALAETARIALAGQDRVETNDEYDTLTKGLFDPIVRLTKGMSDPSSQLELLIEKNSSW